MINNSKADIVEIFIWQPKCSVKLVNSSRKISMNRSMHLQTCRILTVECINGMVTPIHCNNNRPRRHDCRCENLLETICCLWSFAIVTYIYLFPRLPLSHTHVHFSTQVEISAESTNFKNINKVTWIRIMRSNCDFYAKNEIVKVGL